MRTNLPVASALSLVCAAFLLAGQPVRADQDGPALTAVRAKGTSSVMYAGQVLRTTTATVAKQRVILPDRSSKVIALWDEVTGGDTEHYYALSLDNGRTFPLVLPTTYQVRLVYATFDPLQGEPPVPATLRADADGHTYMVQFVIPPVDEFRRDLAGMGATVERFLTDHVHVVHMTAAVAARVAALPYVRWVGPYHPAYKLSADVRADLQGSTDLGAVRYSIECMERGAGQQGALSDLIRKMGGVVEITTPDQFRMEATLTPAQLLTLAKRDEVNYIDPWGGPGGADMIVIRHLEGATTDNNGTPLAGFSGQGVRGEVFDTEVRMTHQAFQNPVPLLHGGSAGSGAAAGYHGSACYGINFANWAANPTYNGMCTSAEQGIFIFYPLCTQFGGTVSRLTQNTEATDPAGPYLSSYQTSSIGSAQITTYTTISAEVDDYLMRVDYLSCQSQSNTGNQQSRPQAWAKNIVSVGGIQWNGTLSRTDDIWATGASCGPAADGRVKPDLANCFDAIPATWGENSDTDTTVFSGTSGATPITAGCFGLLNEMWHQGVWTGFGGGSSVFSDRPRSATAKAMMINTAYRYPLTQGGLARAKQGWGMPAVNALYNIRAKTFIVNETDLLTTGATQTYHLTVVTGEPVLAATMVYIDPQGDPAASHARVNDISLKVTAPNSTVYWGNNGLNTSNFSTSGGSANTIDTVENVFIQNPAAGDWTIQVIGTSIVQDAHLATPGIDAAFGLAVTGARPPLTMVLPSGPPPLLSPIAPTDIAVQIIPGAQTVASGTAAVKYRFNSSASYQTAPMVSLGGNDYRATIPSPACTDNPDFYFTVSGNLGSVVNLPASAPAQTYAAAPGTGYITPFTDDFETDQGWSGAAPDDNATSGRWTRNVPQATAAQPGANHTPTGTMCWVTDYRAGQQVSDYDVDGGKTTLTSPLFDASTLNRGTISYWRWYSNGVGLTNPNTNTFVVDISNDAGVTWVNAETVGPAGPDTVGGWIQHTFSIASFVQPSSTMLIRFVASDYTGSIVEAAIDDFAVTGIVCSTPCYANCDGSTTPPVLNINDFTCFLNRFAAGDPWANCDHSTAPPTLNILDFSCFLNAFTSGCP